MGNVVDYPRLRRFRIGIEDGDGFRPIVGVVPMGPGGQYPGGFAVCPSDSDPKRIWKYGPIDIPAGPGPVTGRMRASEAVEVGGAGPKVHYHRHGYISASRTGDGPNVGFDATAIDVPDMAEHRHCFTVISRRPLLYPSESRRAADQWFRIGGAGKLETFELVGYVGATSNLKPPFDRPPQNPFMADLVQDDNAAAPTVVAVLTGNGVDRYLWFEAKWNRPISWENDDGGPSTCIYVFDHTAMSSSSEPGVIMGLWDLPGT